MLSNDTLKKLRVFAGPNGSGKTTIINEIRTKYNVGSFVNADIIQEELNRKGYLDYSEFCHHMISAKEWIEYLEICERKITNVIKSFKFSDYHLISTVIIDSYEAAVIADFFRSKLVLGSNTFSYETVFSHESKLDFLKLAKKNGFKIYLYFICTQDPKINISRVKNRVILGGHDVSVEKIESRYYRSLDLLSHAFLLADRAFIIDTTSESGEIILEKNESDVNVLVDEIPEWVNKYLINHF
jgi:predicted ABC-type ATPase